jgi:serine/threonine-protein kinase
MPVSPEADSDGGSSAFSVGSVVAGKYLVEGMLGSGGLGAVVVARHVALDQRVAIKYLKPGLTDQEVMTRFLREARLTAQIQSEHAVKVHDVGELDGARPYMVMEYLEGTTLRQKLGGGALAPAVAVDYVLQACDALAEAHALGIVHRDLKPENLFLVKRPNKAPILKIIDFGMSKVTPRHRDASQVHVTRSTERFGTPAFMSPEQLRSATTVDARADIWALGVVLFELITGSLPFDGEDLPQLCTSILMDEPARPSTLVPTIPPALEAALLRCLEKDRRFRFRNVAELAQELGPFGPPGAGERVERIKTTVAQGGASVRPPAPASGPVPVATPPDPAGPAVEPAAPPEEEPSARLPVARPRAPLVLGVAGVSAVVVAIAWALVPRHESRGSSATPPPSAVPVPAATQVTPSPETTATATATAPKVAVDAAATTSPATADSATAAAARGTSAASTRVAAGRASSSQASPAASASGASDRRSLYGARQ